VKASSENWLKIAEKDLKIAKLSLKAEEPMAAVFHMHAAIEKILKGMAFEIGSRVPRSHNLKQLAIDSCRLKLEKHLEELLTELDQSFMDSRYPECIEEFELQYNIEYCQKLLKEVESTFKWLKNLLIES
jgi:HEPN domain-containing protein